MKYAMCKRCFYAQVGFFSKREVPTPIIVILALLLLFLSGAASAFTVNAWLNPGCGPIGKAPCRIWDEEWHYLGLRADGCDRGLERELEWCQGSYTGPITGHTYTYYYPCWRCRNNKRFMYQLLVNPIPDYFDEEISWPTEALSQQRRIARHEPINWVMQVTTHNAFNNDNDGYPYTNQRYSISDQLEMGARAIMLDVHDQGVFDVSLKLSHATVGDSGLHWGASETDRHFVMALIEIKEWLEKNPDEVIILWIEDHLDGDAEAESDFIAALDHWLGNWILREGEKPENRWLSLSEMRSIGRRVIVRNGLDLDTDLLIGGHSVKGYPGTKIKKWDEFWKDWCEKRPFMEGDENKFSHVYEDRLVIWPSVSPVPFYEGPVDAGVIDEPELEKIVRCNISLVGLDKLVPGGYSYDPLTLRGFRLPELVWSWKAPEWGWTEDNKAAVLNRDKGFFSARSGDESYPYLCGHLREGDASLWQDSGPQTEWRITSVEGPWEEGGLACIDEHGDDGFVFSLPVNPIQRDDLVRLMDSQGVDRVWLAYRDVNENEGPPVDWDIDRAGSGGVVARPSPASEGIRVDFERSVEASKLKNPDCKESLRNGVETWIFGDTSTAEDQYSPENLDKLLSEELATFRSDHIFADEGFYNVIHDLPDTCNTDPAFMTMYIVNEKPLVGMGCDTWNECGDALEQSNRAVFIDEPVQIVAAYFDPGQLDTHTALVDWGDETIPQPIEVVADAASEEGATGMVAAEHSYTTCGYHQVEVQVTDNDGAEGSASLNLEVIDKPPSITCPGDRRVVTTTGPVRVRIGDPTLTGNVCTTLEVTNNAPHDSIFGLGMTNVIWKVESSTPVLDEESGDEIYWTDSCAQRIIVTAQRIIDDAPKPPIPNIFANGMQGTTALNKGEHLSLTISLNSNEFVGEQADYWVVATSENHGWFQYSYTGGWSPVSANLEDLVPGFQGPLTTISPPMEILSESDLLQDHYKVYFGVDLDMNGILELSETYLDSIDVSVGP